MKKQKNNKVVRKGKKFVYVFLNELLNKEWNECRK